VKHRSIINVETNKVIIVIGNPAFKNSRGEKCTPSFFDVSRTITLAAEPKNVKLPASVDALARISHCSMLPFCKRRGVRRITAGTLLTMFDNIAVSNAR